MNDISKLKAIDSLSLVDKVELRLINFFEENKMKPGDPIAKELDLAESLGVSRTVVREALLRLRTLGFIESKKHKGMTFKEPNILFSVEKILASNLLGEKTLKSLFELRIILEVGMVEFLFQYKTEKDLIELEEIIKEEEKEQVSKPNIYSLEKEYNFHGKLYQIARNDTLKNFQVLLLPIFNHLYKTETEHEENFVYTNNIFINHRDLLNELKTGTVDSFRNALKKHLEPLYAKVF